MYVTPRARRPARRLFNLNIVGCDNKKDLKMNTQSTVAVSGSKSKLLPIIVSAFIGMAAIFVVGHVQAGALHDAAHDVRHATGFPCH